MSHQIWMNGDLVAHEDAKVHVLTHALHYGTSVFEGVRAYETPDGGSAVFRHQDHIDRLFRSAGALPHGDPVHQGRDPPGDVRRRSPPRA